ncbi:MAG: cupin domain-containing protein [Rhodospirillaceae bacterium]
MTAEELIEHLNLEPHPKEGGFFREIYRSHATVPQEVLPDGYDGARSFSTAIYYLLTPDTFSHLHTVASDETFHFYLGDPVEMLQLFPDGQGQTRTLGQDIATDQHVTLTVPRGVWQGCRLKTGGTFALMGCTVSPGFEYQDYGHADRVTLCARYPDFVTEIKALTEA